MADKQHKKPTRRKRPSRGQSAPAPARRERREASRPSRQAGKDHASVSPEQAAAPRPSVKDRSRRTGRMPSARREERIERKAQVPHRRRSQDASESQAKVQAAPPSKSASATVQSENGNAAPAAVAASAPSDAPKARAAAPAADADGRPLNGMPSAVEVEMPVLSGGSSSETLSASAGERTESVASFAASGDEAPKDVDTAPVSGENNGSSDADATEDAASVGDQASGISTADASAHAEAASAHEVPIESEAAEYGSASEAEGSSDRAAEGQDDATPSRPSVSGRRKAVPKPDSQKKPSRPGFPKIVDHRKLDAIRSKRIRKSVKILLAVVAVIVIVVALFAWQRWYRFDDTQDIQGTWQLAADTSQTVVIDGSNIDIVKGVAYQYTLDTADKTITFTFSDKSGQASYHFSGDRKTLVINESDSQPNILVQLGIVDDPAIADDTLDDEVTVLYKVSDDTSTHYGSSKKSKKGKTESSSSSASSTSSSQGNG
ncbi:MAG: hypothetical protein ACOX1O_00510 [Eggerthellaceae bacterium]